jgi:serine/alanine adding enzyme
MQVFELGDSDEARWNEAVDRLAISHHAFSWKWREIFRRTFGHRPHYLLAEASDGIAALPLFHFKSPLFGSALISVPYLNAGGVYADSSLAVEAILAAVEPIARATDVSYLELRHSELQKLPISLDASREHKVTMTLGLEADPEALFASFPPKLRSQVRRPTKSGLYAESFKGSEIRPLQIDQFYRVFSEHMRDLGTPVYPKALFRNTIRSFGEQCRVLLVHSEQRPVAAGITIGNRDRVEILWASSLRGYNKLSPNMLLYWEALKSACSDGYRTFDFGRSSPESGTYRFKKQWGAQPEKLVWHYRLYRGELPDVNPASPKFQFVVSCWKRLPLPVANLVGPFLTRGIP